MVVNQKTILLILNAFLIVKITPILSCNTTLPIYMLANATATYIEKDILSDKINISWYFECDLHQKIINNFSIDYSYSPNFKNVTTILLENYTKSFYELENLKPNTLYRIFLYSPQFLKVYGLYGRTSSDKMLHYIGIGFGVLSLIILLLFIIFSGKKYVTMKKRIKQLEIKVLSNEQTALSELQCTEKEQQLHISVQQELKNVRHILTSVFPDCTLNISKTNSIVQKENIKEKMVKENLQSPVASVCAQVTFGYTGLHEQTKL